MSIVLPYFWMNIRTCVALDADLESELRQCFTRKIRKTPDRKWNGSTSKAKFPSVDPAITAELVAAFSAFLTAGSSLQVCELPARIRRFELECTFEKSPSSEIR